MNLNISKLSAELRECVTDMQQQLGIVFDAVNGIELNAKEGEAFHVMWEGKQAEIEYPALPQFFRGLLLLKKALAEKQTALNVTETFALGEFGIMLDCSRNAVRNLDALKSMVRHLALMGYNQLQLYTEDTYEVDGEPYFGYLRGKYMRKELTELDDYAARFGIEVVPCIQTLAHVNAIFDWQTYREVRDIDDILLIGEEKTYALIEKMLTSMKRSLRSNKIHIGMDEAHNVGRGKYYDQHGDSDHTKILLEHLDRVVALCKKHGYEPMMWSDMFFRLANNGSYYVKADEGKLDSGVKNLIPEGLRLVYWDYYHVEADDYSTMIDKHFELSDDIVFAGGAWTWSGFAPNLKYSLAATRAAFSALNEKGVKNAFLTMWGDNGGECSLFSVLPALAVAAEIAYGGSGDGATLAALTGLSMDKFMTLELPNLLDEYLPAHHHNPSKYMLYGDPFMGRFDLLVRGGDGKVYQKHIKTLSAVEKNAGSYAYLFTSMRTLCEALEIKYELGVKTRNLYNTGDLRALKSLVKSEYYPLIKKLEAFYESFKVQWMRDNKPQGFEVQDARLGGLIRRVTHCAERLEQYAAGKLPAIPELAEKLLPHTHEKETLKGTVTFNNYGSSISASVK